MPDHDDLPERVLEEMAREYAFMVANMWDAPMVAILYLLMGWEDIREDAKAAACRATAKATCPGVRDAAMATAMAAMTFEDPENAFRAIRAARSARAKAW